MAFSGINFRASAGFVTDGSAETYSVGEVYPITRNGLTFGWATSQSANTRDRNAGVDRRLAGIAFQGNSGGTTTFRLDLPTGPGTYRVRLALGDDAGSQNIRVIVRDGTGGTALATINGATLTTAEWLDAAGNRWLTPAGWVANNVTPELAFTATHLILEIGGHSSGTAASSIGHLAVEPVSGGGATANGVTLTATASLIAGSALGPVGTLNFQAAGMEFGRRTGLAINTFALDASQSYRYTAHADGLVLGAPIFTSGVVATDATGKLPNVSNAAFVAGATVWVCAVRQADGQRAVFPMVVS